MNIFIGNTKKSAINYSFQYFRVFFLFLVICTHLKWFSPNNLFALFFDKGNISVTFFFVLAGYFHNNFIKKQKYKKYRMYIYDIFHKKKDYFIRFYIYFIVVGFYAFIISRYNILQVIQYGCIDLMFLPVIIPHCDNFMIFSSWYFMTYVLCMVFSVQSYNLLHLKQKKAILNICILILLHLSISFFSYKFVPNIAGWIMYNSIYSRLIDFTIGMILKDLHDETVGGLTFPSIQEILAIVIVITISIVKIPIMWSYSIILCAISYLIYVFSFENGKISSIFKKNIIITNICKHSFSIYLFHFIIMMYSFLSPWSPSIYLNLVVSILFIVIVENLLMNFKI